MTYPGRYVGFFVTDHDHELLVELAKREDCHMSELLRSLIRAEAQRTGVASLLSDVQIQRGYRPGGAPGFGHAIRPYREEGR